MARNDKSIWCMERKSCSFTSMGDDGIVIKLNDLHCETKMIFEEI